MFGQVFVWYFSLTRGEKLHVFWLLKL